MADTEEEYEEVEGWVFCPREESFGPQKITERFSHDEDPPLYIKRPRPQQPEPQEERVELTEERYWGLGDGGGEFIYTARPPETRRRVRAVILEPAHQHRFICRCGESHE